MHGEITRYVENEVMTFHLVSRVHELDVTYGLAPAAEPTRLRPPSPICRKSARGQNVPVDPSPFDTMLEDR
jgi:hypothetical protein